MPHFPRSFDPDPDDAFAAWAAEPLEPLEPLSPPYRPPTRSWASEWLPESMRAELADEPEISVWRPAPRS